MSNNLYNQIRSTIRRALYGTLGIPMLALPIALAQQATNEPVKMEKTVVTGSLIPTAETVGPAPVDIVSAERIQQLGSQDVLATLKALNPGFAGNANVGQTVNNGGFGEANIALRNLPTLVLLNGRRLGNSSFSNGALVDVNTIPLSMIERIEVLKDGASALYGSAAIGGVVNIITKKEYNGAEISGRYGFATGAGTYTEERASAVLGTANENGWLTAGGQFFKTDPLLSKDRKIASLSNAERAALGFGPASYISPSFPGKVQGGERIVGGIPVQNGFEYLLAGSPFLIGHAGYNPAINTPPIVPGFRPTPDPTAPPGFEFRNTVDQYNLAAIGAGYVDPTGNGFGPYVKTRDPRVGLGSATLLNTPLFGTHSIQSQDRKQFFTVGEHNLIEKQLQLFVQFLYANTESIGTLAPSPVISLFDANIFIPSNNVYNPFGIDLGPVGGSSTPRIRSRFVQSGNRIFDNVSDFFHIVGGLKGEFESGWTYNVGYTFNRYDQTAFTKNAINGAALDQALRPNPDPVLAARGLSALATPAGFVPQYNFFFTPTQPFPTTQGPNDPLTIQAMKTTLYQSGRTEEWDADGVITGQPLDLPGGKLGVAFGGGLRSESLAVDFDGLTRIGKVPGLNFASPTSGRRDSYAVFGEVRLPLTSPDQDIPGLRSLEVTAAGRFESYDPGGDSAVPKVGVRWQPLDEQLTLRGTYSQSFVAPTVFQLFGGDAANFPQLSLPDGQIQVQTINVSNDKLHPVDAENYGGGIVVSPKAVPGLTLSVDYYHIKVKNDIFRLSEQAMVNSLEDNGSASIYADRFRFDNGSRLTTTATNQITTANFGTLRVPLANGAETETHGLDINASYRLSRWQDTAGVFTFYAGANVLLKYQYDDPSIHVNGNDPSITGPYRYEGQYTDRVNGIGGGQGLLPDWQINTGLSWEFRDFTYSVNARYIPEVKDLGFLHPSVIDPNNPDQGFTLDGKARTVESWYSIDMQLAYEIGKRKAEKSWYDATTIRVGVNNITDENPPFISSSFEDNTDKSTYDILGRFVYFELAKKF